MTRNDLMGEVTGLAGEVLATLKAEGIVFRHRDVIVFTEHFCRLYRDLPEPDAKLRAKANRLINLLIDEDANHGTLRLPETNRARDELKLELGRP